MIYLPSSVRQHPSSIVRRASVIVYGVAIHRASSVQHQPVCTISLHPSCALHPQSRFAGYG
eukprot:10184063-Lingulodinium_polyedra.AAC.1